MRPARPGRRSHAAAPATGTAAAATAPAASQPGKRGPAAGAISGYDGTARFLAVIAVAAALIAGLRRQSPVSRSPAVLAG